jgi:hypothetical protein
VEIGASWRERAKPFARSAVLHGMHPKVCSSALGQYRAGSDTHSRVAGPRRCFGVKPNDAWGGAVARVTVVY